ncbi:MAG TPA: hypothetical protein VF407_18665 [Polyangiaceae bacterium]
MGVFRPFGFTRLSARQIFLPLFFVPFLVAAVILDGATLDVLKEDLAVRRYHPSDQQSLGRVVIEGKVTRAAPVVSPLGKSGIGWVGTLGYLSTHDHNTSFISICTRADLSELSVQAPAGSTLDHMAVELDDAGALAVVDTQADHRWSLTFTDPGRPVVLGHGDTLGADLPVVDIGEPAAQKGAPIPELMKSLCAAELAKNDKTLLYREAVLANDVKVAVLGCSNDAAHLLPCDDGGPFAFTSTPLADVRANARFGGAMMAIFSCLWSLMVLSMCGFLVARYLARTTPTFQESLRAK